jgi:hypothetical protein
LTGLPHELANRQVPPLLVEFVAQHTYLAERPVAPRQPCEVGQGHLLGSESYALAVQDTKTLDELVMASTIEMRE